MVSKPAAVKARKQAVILHSVQLSSTKTFPGTFCSLISVRGDTQTVFSLALAMDRSFIKCLKVALVYDDYL